MVVKPHPLVNITPATITEPGQVVSVSIHSFVAGTAPEKIAQQMAQAARQQVYTHYSWRVKFHDFFRNKKQE